MARSNTLWVAALFILSVLCALQVAAALISNEQSADEESAVFIPLIRHSTARHRRGPHSNSSSTIAQWRSSVEYYALLSIGTPGVSVRVQVDTGSPVSVITSVDCYYNQKDPKKKCGKSSKKKLYNRTASSTSKVFLPNENEGNKSSNVKMSFADGSRLEGQWITDTVTPANVADNGKVKPTKGFAFVYLTGENEVARKYSYESVGILGLGPSPPLTAAGYKKLLKNDVFTLSLMKPRPFLQSGVATGEVKKTSNSSSNNKNDSTTTMSKLLHYVPMKANKVPVDNTSIDHPGFAPSSYQVEIASISFAKNGLPLPAASRVAIVDSGTFMLQFPSLTVAYLKKEIEKSLCSNTTASTEATKLCSNMKDLFELSDEGEGGVPASWKSFLHSNLPPLKFHFLPSIPSKANSSFGLKKPTGAVEVNVSAKEYLMEVACAEATGDNQSSTCIAFAVSSLPSNSEYSNFIFLGEPFMQSTRVVFDLPHKRIGFFPSRSIPFKQGSTTLKAPTLKRNGTTTNSTSKNNTKNHNRLPPSDVNGVFNSSKHRVNGTSKTHNSSLLSKDDAGGTTSPKGGKTTVPPKEKYTDEPSTETRKPNPETLQTETPVSEKDKETQEMKNKQDDEKSSSEPEATTKKPKSTFAPHEQDKTTDAQVTKDKDESKSSAEPEKQEGTTKKPKSTLNPLHEDKVTDTQDTKDKSSEEPTKKPKSSHEDEVTEVQQEKKSTPTDEMKEASTETPKTKDEKDDEKTVSKEHKKQEKADSHHHHGHSKKHEDRKKHDENEEEKKKKDSSVTSNAKSQQQGDVTEPPPVTGKKSALKKKRGENKESKEDSEGTIPPLLTEPHTFNIPHTGKTVSVTALDVAALTLLGVAALAAFCVIRALRRKFARV